MDDGGGKHLKHNAQETFRLNRLSWTNINQNHDINHQSLSAEIKVEQHQQLSLHHDQDRRLQLDPTVVCDNYAAFEQQQGYSCECDRYEQFDVIVNCTDTLPASCNADNTTCYNRTLALVVNDEALTIISQLCSLFTETPLLQQQQSDNGTMQDQLDICFTTRPVVAGNYDAQGMESCVTSLNGQECLSCTILQSDDDISQCQQDSALSQINITGGSYVDFDCTNIWDDIQGTCQLAVSGLIVPNFDTSGLSLIDNGNTASSTTSAAFAVTSTAMPLVSRIIVSSFLMIPTILIFGGE
jgi:hypothetical protein